MTTEPVVRRCGGNRFFAPRSLVTIVLVLAVGGASCSSSGGSEPTAVARQAPPTTQATIAEPPPETPTTTERAPLVEVQPPVTETPTLDPFEEEFGFEEEFPSEEGPFEGPVVEATEPVDVLEESPPPEEESGDEVGVEIVIEDDPFAEQPGSESLLRRRLLRAGDPATAAGELTRLSEDPDSAVRMAVARNPATPPDVLMALADGDAHPGVRWWAAANPSNWPEARAFPPLVDPVEIEPEDVEEGEAIEVDDRTYVGVNPGPWEYVLAALATDVPARLWAAANPHTPPGALLALAGDLEPDVVVWVATNPNAPLLALEYVAETEDPLACRALAANPAAPPHLLARIAAKSLAGRLVTGRTPIGCEVPGALVGVARNPNTWPETLAALAEDVASGVRAVVAGNRAALPSTLEGLAADEEVVVRAAVAANPVTPPEVLARLLEDDEPIVRWAAATNPATPPEALAALAEDAGALGGRVPPTDPLPELPAEPAAPEEVPAEDGGETGSAEEAAEDDGEAGPPEEVPAEDDGETGSAEETAEDEAVTP